MDSQSRTLSILVVDDKLSVQQLLNDFLTSHNCSVVSASNGVEALQIIKQSKPDLVLLDIMMPLMDGYALLDKIRENSQLPVILISAKQEEQDIVRGFDHGADDYIIKPFRMQELLARIKAVLKRSNHGFTHNDQLIAGPLSLDITRNELRAEDEVIDVTKAECALLKQLMQSVESAVNKAEISCSLIEQGFSGSESTLKIHVRNLRKKLEPSTKGQVEIESVFGIGYRLKVIGS
ncbi:response regulator transcription factor [Vibrio ulleungensis]|uniref:Response regulator transcription factor n=1 Tax=Vibrio ulleungensis TaxID=2807619 RepID=A0ABS2HGG5_9VIBR|nr:response regulator transcription factor [Vibrio ulleungensis]MBM7036615.1 response regulator transcription factor [Vibrio ulleungensis]